jgi:methylmalonyl-CoA/ethylmalonyl-CoA epimerase
MGKVKKVDHIAIVVEDIEVALSFWRDALGLELERVEQVPEQAAQVAFLPLGGCEIELVRPITEDSGLVRYLQKRGPGMHHVCFQVDDIRATLQDLKSKSIRLINEEPLVLEGGKKIAFIHPENTGGVLVELYEL